MRWVGVAIAIMMSLTLFLGWMGNAPQQQRPARKPPVVKTVQSRSYNLGSGEHMTLVDIPDLYVPRRCAIFTNDASGRQLLSCNFDDAGTPFPETSRGD